MHGISMLIVDLAVVPCRWRIYLVLPDDFVWGFLASFLAFLFFLSFFWLLLPLPINRSPMHER